MQNRYCSASEAGFVTLSGRWVCPRCGCANECGDVCRECGWNRCGCQGGVVWTETRSTRTSCDCEAVSTRARDNGCDDCPASFTTGHSVQCCPDNTRIRRDNDCGCNGDNAAYQTRSGKSDCGCSGDNAAYQNRSGKSDCGCNGDNAAYQTRSSRSDCGCSGDNAAYQNRANARVGIVHAAKQKLADVFESESALRTGTLFPELHKPMNGRCPDCSNCSTCDQQSSFAAWDLRLYLNTHPDDKEALALFRRLCEEADDPNYATAFLEGKGGGWNWTDDPWPWECQKCGD